MGRTDRVETERILHCNRVCSEIAWDVICGHMEGSGSLIFEAQAWGVIKLLLDNSRAKTVDPVNRVLQSSGLHRIAEKYDQINPL